MYCPGFSSCLLLVSFSLGVFTIFKLKIHFSNYHMDRSTLMSYWYLKPHLSKVKHFIILPLKHQILKLSQWHVCLLRLLSKKHELPSVSPDWPHLLPITFRWFFHGKLSSVSTQSHVPDQIHITTFPDSCNAFHLLSLRPPRCIPLHTASAVTFPVSKCRHITFFT